jgi:hypothetical protein
MGDIATTILTSVVTSLVTALLAYVGYGRKMKADLQREYASRFNERKWEAYTGFADMLRQLFESTAKGKSDRVIPKITGRLYEFASELWIAGSDEVFDAFNRWLRECRAPGEREPGSTESLVSLAHVIVEMRKDLGYASTTITPKDLLTPFVTDIHKHL